MCLWLSRWLYRRWKQLCCHSVLPLNLQWMQQSKQSCAMLILLINIDLTGIWCFWRWNYFIHLRNSNYQQCTIPFDCQQRHCSWHCFQTDQCHLQWRHSVHILNFVEFLALHSKHHRVHDFDQQLSRFQLWWPSCSSESHCESQSLHRMHHWRQNSRYDFGGTHCHDCHFSSLDHHWNNRRRSSPPHGHCLHSNNSVRYSRSNMQKDRSRHLAFLRKVSFLLSE